MKNLVASGITVALSFTTIFAASVSDVTARQRYPWNGMVDVEFTVAGDSGIKYAVSLSAKDMIGGTNLTMRTIYKPDGTMAKSPELLLPGRYWWVWNAQADLPRYFVCNRTTVDVAATFSYSVKFNANGGSGSMTNEIFAYGEKKTLTANAFNRTGYVFKGWATSSTGTVVYQDKASVLNLTTTANGVVNLYAVWQEALYMVVDLSGGSNATKYVVSYLEDVPSTGWTKEYKASKLVLRQIKPSSYISGDGTVTLTKSYYMGIFECTQKQYVNVMGINPACRKGDTRPVERISYDMIRGTQEGARWPSSSAVDSTSFMGKLRSKTGLEFDLPTRAQWECASLGGQSDKEALALSLSRVAQNQSDGKGGYSGSHTEVGSYTPNAWGIYDMIGNVCEWVLDCDRDFTMKGVDPVGPSCYWSDGTLCNMRVVMGELWFSSGSAGQRMSAVAKSWDWSYATDPYNYYRGTHGFRICLPMDK